MASVAPAAVRMPFSCHPERSESLRWAERSGIECGSLTSRLITLFIQSDIRFDCEIDAPPRRDSAAGW